MFRKILYPTDFSDVSKNALSYLKQLKKSGVEEIFVLHVIDKRDVQFSYLYLFDESSPDGNLEQKLKDEATRELKEIEGKLKEWGFKVLSRVKLGSPIKEILSAEQKEDISIIVIGSHGKSNIEEMLLGSVSENIIRKCKKPVLVVKR
ncbi:MAG: universal stress protein [Deltaproteobacteria bacterium]|jgi:nucleotide-binding universal stress UspA family protein|nr:universal stress protein [Deltaproteobacteria bacterium]MBW1747645.1 universal stress protein [Deltaproteobacteria bacterium]MBW1826593.1 universal stress protein [Deltaproteobacteria bacterium]MBW1969600.1 universal stress protein [Deltaproteobacteria bacterium]MBW2156569.1 universal stress protein [Deltaproteobacteria bacterium]